ncbi:hypothetical protein Taro_005321 [Colocasia esculenta]|uniref:Uncharacterized protein n=1 Tax=Colocasia esculenta TaxID=4460 RepID=A0A843TKK9_COLES|nr:hypothetical protein [Colocasia esculenta]
MGGGQGSMMVAGVMVEDLLVDGLEGVTGLGVDEDKKVLEIREQLSGLLKRLGITLKSCDRDTQTMDFDLEMAIPALEVVGDRSGEARLDVPSSSRRKRAGKSRVANPTSYGDSSASCSETDEDAADSFALDNYNPLSGGSPPLCNREYGSSLQAAEVFLPEIGDDGPPPHNPFFGTAAMESDNTIFTFAELGLSTEQYP